MARARGVLLTALVMLAATTANAQQTPIQGFKITDIGGDLFVKGDARREKQNRSFNTRTRERDIFFEQGVNLDIGSYIYHPNFVDLNTSFTVGLTQKRLKVDDERFDSDGSILGYDVTAAILKEKPLSLRLFASQSENVLNRNFAGTFDLDTSQSGLELFLGGGVPISLVLERLTRREEDELRITDERTDHLLLKISDRRDPDWYTELSYDHKDTDEPAVFFSPGGVDPVKQDLSSGQDELNLSNQWRFGSDPNKLLLSGHLRALRRRGIFDNDTFSIDQRLELAHTDTFSTFYRGAFHSDEIDAEKEESITGEMGFSKQFYESLDVTGRGYLTNTDFNDGFERIGGGELDIDYQKKTPLGLLSSAVRMGLECETERIASGQRSITNEGVHLVGTLPARLESPNVVSSLLVTNIAMTVIYVENLDYVVTGLGAFTGIRSRLLRHQVWIG